MSKKRKLLIGTALGISNVFVVMFVAGLFLKDQTPLIYFSLSEHKNKITKKCKKHIKFLQEQGDEGDSKRCIIRTRKHHEGASYKVKYQITLEKQKDGKIQVSCTHSIQEPTRHATEAQFCEGDCGSNPPSINETMDTVQIISDLAECTFGLEEEIRKAVREAKLEYDRKKTEAKMGQEKERRCLGKWYKAKRDEEGYFEDFSIEDQVTCKFQKLRTIRDPKLRELEYQNLRGDLWKLAASDDDNFFLREQLLETMNDSHYSPYTRSSTELLSMYLGWRERYDSMDSLEERLRLIRSIQREAGSFSHRLHPEYADSEIKFLNSSMNKNFHEAMARLESLPLPSSTAGRRANQSLPKVDYRKAEEGTKDLW